MAIGFDSLSPDTTGNAASSLTSGSWTIAGADRLLIGGIGIGAGTPAAHSSMKWGGSGGTNLTQISTTLTVGLFGRLSAWYLIAPAASSTTLYGSWAASQDECCIGGVSLTGCKQTVSPVGTAATATGSISPPTATGTATVNVTTVAGDVVLALFWIVDQGGGSPTFTPTGGATERYYVPGSALTYESMLISSLTASGTSTTMSASITCSGTDTATWGVIAFVVNAAAAASPSFAARAYLRPRPFAPGGAR